MPDIVAPGVRSRMMSAIRSKNTRPELQVRKYLHSRGFRFRVSVRELPGRPDVVLPKWRCAVFVHGCFWHGHPGCRFAYSPKTRPEFWSRKIAANAARDLVAVNSLRNSDWRVVVIWECALRRTPDAALAGVEHAIASGARLTTISSRF
jgi:DNA mismatch endonuclease (patch repair protein)